MTLLEHPLHQDCLSVLLEKEALSMGLKINDNKTKYIPCTKSGFNNSHFKIEEYNFEVVDSFTYLGSEFDKITTVQLKSKSKLLWLIDVLMEYENI
ncbi:hypothetical protein TNCV_502711 [Trichonephila clavipes]|nr:hypothetical protein TNCV_502711 [Trichonephila clavipes]